MRKLILGVLAALSLSGCTTLFGVDPEDADAVRADAKAVVAVVQVVEATIGVVLTEVTAFCGDEANAGSFPCNNPEVIAAANDVSMIVGTRLAQLQAALEDGKTEAVMIVELTRLALGTAGDVTKILNDLRGVSPAAAAAVAEMKRGVTDSIEG